MDHGLSKGAILITCIKTISAEEVAQLLVKYLFSRFSLPDKIISDRGPNLAAQSIQEFFKLLGIELALTTAYHPQGDGTTERFNQEIEAYLSIYCTAFPGDWSQALPILEFVHNSRRHSGCAQSPFELIMGENPLSIPMAHVSSKFPAVKERLETLQAYQHEALAAHELARVHMANKITSTFKPFTEGQKVWLEAKNLSTSHHKKIQPQ